MVSLKFQTKMSRANWAYLHPVSQRGDRKMFRAHPPLLLWNVQKSSAKLIQPSFSNQVNSLQNLFFLHQAAQNKKIQGRDSLTLEQKSWTLSLKPSLVTRTVSCWYQRENHSQTSELRPLVASETWLILRYLSKLPSEKREKHHLLSICESKTNSLHQMDITQINTHNQNYSLS